MPRISKKVTNIEPPPELSKEPEDYLNYGSALLRYGLMQYERAMTKKALPSGNNEISLSTDGIIANLLPEQVQYLNMRMAGIGIIEACRLLKVDSAAPLLWELENDGISVYKFCLDAITQVKGIAAEDMVTSRAINDPSATLERMFLVKKVFPEYRDNYQGAGQNLVQVNITVDGQSFAPETMVEVKEVEE